MAINTEEIGKALFEKLKANMHSGSIKSQVSDFRGFVKGTSDISTTVKKIKKMPSKVTVKTPIFSDLKNVLPFGQLIPEGATFNIDKPTTEDIVEQIKTGIPAPGPVINPPITTYDPIPDTPAPDQIIVDPHPILKDEVTAGADVDPSYKETYPESNIIDTPLKDISVGDLNFGIDLPKLPDLKDLGKYALLIGGGLIAILLLTRRK